MPIYKIIFEKAAPKFLDKQDRPKRIRLYRAIYRLSDGTDIKKLKGHDLYRLRVGDWPHEYIISGERISPYLLFSNTHDGSGAIKVALTPIRVVCQNTLNLALVNAKHSWSMIHTGDIKEKMQEAKDTLFLAENYMDELGKEFEALRMKKLTDKQVMEYIEILLPIEDGSTPQQEKNMKRLREDMKIRYFDAPDLQGVGKNAYRFINAVSDFATHAEPLRRTANYKENLFSRTVDGNPVIDKAYQIVCAA